MNTDVQPSAPTNARQLVKRALTSTLPRSAFLVHGPRDARQVCLTFDDGPHPIHTPRLLDTLDQLGVRATFFVVGECAAAHPAIVRRMAAAGHAIGHHSYTHGPPETTSARTLLAEARETRSLLERIVGKPPRLFRPPHGKLTMGKLVHLWMEGQTIVLWSVDPKDFECASVGEALARLEHHPPQKGDIVLLHDNQPHVAEITTAIVRDVQRRGLTPTTIDAWL